MQDDYQHFSSREQVSQRTGVPYVLDFDDAWTIIPTDFDYRKPPWATRSIRRTMYRLLKGAQAVVFRYDTEAECFWRAYRGALDASKDLHHTERLRISNRGICTPTGKRCTILYAGTLPDYRYDTLLKSLIVAEGDRSQLGQSNCVFFSSVKEWIALANEAAVLGLSEHDRDCRTEALR